MIAIQVGKTMPTFEQWWGVEPATPPRQQTPDEIERMGLRWHYALNAKP